MIDFRDSKYYNPVIVLDSANVKPYPQKLINLIITGHTGGYMAYYNRLSLFRVYNIDEKLFNDEPYIGRNAERELALAILTGELIRARRL